MKRFDHRPKITRVIVALFALVALMALTGCAPFLSSSTVELQLTSVQFEEGGVVLADHYTLTDGGGTVMSGALDGLEISFAMPEQTDQIKFAIQLPSVEGFRVWESYDSTAQKIIFHYELAELPLTLTDEDFADSIDAFDQPAPATIDLEVWNRISEDSFDVDYFRFSDFELTLTEFYIEGDRLWMDATLNGSMDPFYLEYTGALYKLSATITLDGVTLGVMDVD